MTLQQIKSPVSSTGALRTVKFSFTNFPDLEATTQEILRLAGTAAGVSRIATKDTVVLGKSIPKGTTLYLPLALIATMPLEDIAAIPNSESAIHQKWQGNTLMQFKPERWLDDEGQFNSQVGMQSAPFSAGQRGCFGKALAVSHTIINATHSSLADLSSSIIIDAGIEDYAGQDQLSFLPGEDPD